MSQIHNDSDEQDNNLDAIETLARETKRPFTEVKQVYEAELARLMGEARITDYIPLFASRRARATLSRLTN